MSFDIGEGESVTVDSGTTRYGDPCNIDGTLNLGGTLNTSASASKSSSGVLRTVGETAGGGVHSPTVSGTVSVLGAVSEPFRLQTGVSRTIEAGETYLIPEGRTAYSDPANLDGTLNIDGTLNTSDVLPGESSGSVRVEGVASDSLRYSPTATIETRVSGDVSRPTRTAWPTADGRLRVAGEPIPSPAAFAVTDGELSAIGVVAATPTRATDVSGSVRVSGAITFPQLSPLRLSSSGELRVEATADGYRAATPLAHLETRVSGSVDATPTAAETTAGVLRVESHADGLHKRLSPNVDGVLTIDGEIVRPEVPLLLRVDATLRIDGDTDPVVGRLESADGRLRVDGDVSEPITPTMLRRRSSFGLDNSRRDDMTVQGAGETD